MRTANWHFIFLPSKCLIEFWKPRGKFGVYCNNEDYCGKTRVVKDKWKSIWKWLMTEDVGGVLHFDRKYRPIA